MKSLIEYLNEGYEYTYNLSKSEQDWVNSTKSINRNKVQPKTKRQLKKLIYASFQKGIYDLNFIDTSKITDMSGLFSPVSEFNVNSIHTAYGEEMDISSWDVSNVTNMSNMFSKCKYFNCDLSNWDVSKVTNMAYMFEDCTYFNCDLSKWNVSKVTDMDHMFTSCIEFEGIGLENWNVSKVTDMDHMFYFCKEFKCNLSKWKVSKVTNMNQMFVETSLTKTPKWYKE